MFITNINTEQCLLLEVNKDKKYFKNKLVFTCRIKLEQFDIPEGKNGFCGTDSFSISTAETGNLSSVDIRQQICGQKEGMESKLSLTLHGMTSIFDSYRMYFILN